MARKEVDLQSLFNYVFLHMVLGRRRYSAVSFESSGSYVHLKAD
jgi:hypothetical protein